MDAFSIQMGGIQTRNVENGQEIVVTFFKTTLKKRGELYCERRWLVGFCIIPGSFSSYMEEKDSELLKKPSY